MILLMASPAQATSWQTANSGYWSDPGTWVSGTVPPLQINDTIVISHPVAVSGDLDVGHLGFVTIDSTGGICGHQRLRLDSSGLVLCSGVLQMDSLIVLDGIMYCLQPSRVIIQTSAFVALGGFLQVLGLMQVGQWFNCQMPQFAFTGVSDPAASAVIDAFPNPTLGKFHLKWEGGELMQSLTVRDVHGQIVAEQSLYVESETAMDLSGLPAGLYSWELRSSTDALLRGKVVLQR